MTAPRWRFRRNPFPCGAHAPKHAAHGRPIKDPKLARPDKETAKDFCSACRLPYTARITSLVVEAANFVEARTVAYEEFHTTELRWDETTDPAEVVVTWEGNDYSKAAGAAGKVRVLTRTETRQARMDRVTRLSLAGGTVTLDEFMASPRRRNRRT